MVLGTKPGPSGRVTSVLNLRVFCLALSFTSFWDNSFKKYSQVLHVMHSHMTAPPPTKSLYVVQLLYDTGVTHIRTT